MKKHISIISAAVLLGSLLLLGGCNKSAFSHKGELITFGTTASGSMTRAAYGDDFPETGTPTLQRIDWEDGDVIRIVSDNAAVTNNGSNLKYADYTVTSATRENDGSSKAEVTTNPNGLTWTGASSYNFWGVYPSTVPISEDGAVSADFIPASQTLPTETTTKTVGTGESAITYTVYEPDIANHVLTASALGVKENDEEPQVVLHFKPAFTAIEFNLSSQDDDIEITQLQLVAQTNYLAGPFTMTAGDLATVAPTAASASSTVTLTTGNGVTVTQAEGATFTMFLLPVSNTETLKFRLTSKEDDGTKTSFVNLTRTVNGEKVPFVFEAGKKYRINGFKAPGSSWKIFIASEFLNLDEWEGPEGIELIVE